MGRKARILSAKARQKRRDRRTTRRQHLTDDQKAADAERRLMGPQSLFDLSKATLIIQDAMLERAFHDQLFPKLLFK